MSDATVTVERLLRAVLDGFGLDGELSIEEDPERGVVAVIDGSGLEPLVGRDGEVIDAIQYLAHQAIMRTGDGERRRVLVDVAGYRARRRVQLERLAEHAATEALRHQEEIELDAMTPHDRRIVHLALSERADIVTRSEGEEPHRRIVVLPAALAADDV